MIRAFSWVLVELVGEGTVPRKEYENEEQAQAALWRCLTMRQTKSSGIGLAMFLASRSGLVNEQR